ncbi:endonuclease/exonuclease/phosphatase family protein [Salipiger sp. IMCC34102]|uniref:endonuclease/exonuclease/phosphatase family protein n=1 Tax=Salipiger sp. IMCC34102 TaxID=2510647 RepID=UPI00101DA537|nr:endonuclease/exonuclease/phosphatase family protein [Salipiger sp. IMCC34102]RYH02365.1 endonuclease/exonuclease/phosphatase family protein [Salipiger sp. IMCC34102]
MRNALIRLFGTVTLLLAAATALSELRVDIWLVRFLDFPRLQIAAGLVVTLILYVALRRRPGLGTLITLAGLAALGQQARVLWPYQPLATEMASNVLRCEPGDELRILVTNVQQTNRQDAAVIEMARTHAPDIFIVMETSAWWDEALADLQGDFAHSTQVVERAPEYYGMQVYSQFPFDDARFDYPMNAETPMFDGRIAHPSRPLHLLGVHPRPPLQTNGGQPSTMRDATVLDAALRARESDAVTLVAGDFNATPWNDTARQAMRIGGLLDPRVGRGPMNSYKAGSDVMRWPLDQVLWQAGPGLLDMQILPSVGSDHQPVRVDLCLSPDIAARTIPLRDGDLERAEDTLEAARALQQAEG